MTEKLYYVDNKETTKFLFFEKISMAQNFQFSNLTYKKLKFCKSKVKSSLKLYLCSL